MWKEYLPKKKEYEQHAQERCVINQQSAFFVLRPAAGGVVKD
jgi:hypothetical protein